MKKFSKFIGFGFAAALVMGFAACSSEPEAHEHTFADEGSKLTLVTYLGSKTPSVAKAVGDIVFNDGSATPYTADLTLTADQKAAAIAVIFKAEDGKILGVGLKHDRNGLVWCLNDAKSYSKKITTILCPESGDVGALTFTGDTDGSDNLEQIADFLGEEDDTTGEGAKDKYPAFYYAKNYKDVTGSNVKDTDYAEDWYLPTVAELFDVWKVKETVDAASELCGGGKFGTSNYCSSSQYAYLDGDACLLNFKAGELVGSNKYGTTSVVCCIRSFN